MLNVELIPKFFVVTNTRFAVSVTRVLFEPYIEKYEKFQKIVNLNQILRIVKSATAHDTSN